MENEIDVDASDYARALAEGKDELQLQHFSEGLKLFTTAHNLSDTNYQIAESAQQMGMCYARLGQPVAADASFTIALMYSEATDAALFNRTKRDFAEAINIRLQENSKSIGGEQRYNLDNKAEKLFKESFEYFHFEEVDLNEAAATLSLWGFFIFVHQDKEVGIRSMQRAMKMALEQQKPNEVYVINGLIRLMRASRKDRKQYLGLALQLTDKSSESSARRKEVYAVIFGGNTGYKLAKRVFGK